MVATGCGGRGDSPPGGGASGNAEAARSANRDPCSLITREEAEAILGTPLTVAPVTGGPPTCEYKPATGTRLNGFTITVYWTGGRETLETMKAGRTIATTLMNSCGLHYLFPERIALFAYDLLQVVRPDPVQRFGPIATEPSPNRSPNAAPPGQSALTQPGRPGGTTQRSERWKPEILRA